MQRQVNLFRQEFVKKRERLSTSIRCSFHKGKLTVGAAATLRQKIPKKPRISCLVEINLRNERKWTCRIQKVNFEV